MRFRCLHKSSGYLGYVPIRAIRIIGSCVILHNICMQYNIPLERNENEDDEDNDDNDNLEDSEDENDGNDAPDGVAVRDVLVQQRFP